MEARDAKLIADKLDLVIALLGAQLGRDQPLSQRVPMLSSIGLDRVQIARACGTNPEVVSVRLSEARRATKSTKKTSKRADDLGPDSD